MRIVAGAWRGRTLVAPPGQGTRPTADRVRQALFDMLMHAEWGGRAAIEGAAVLDVFAGTGALGLEALSRGAATACFIEQDAAALRALRANVAACKAEERVEIVAGDVLRLHPGITTSRDAPSPDTAMVGDRAPAGAESSLPVMAGEGRSSTRYGTENRQSRVRPPFAGHDGERKAGGLAVSSLIFLDPPYGRNLVPRAIDHLREAGRIAPGALVVAEIGRDETWTPDNPLLADRQHGAARMLIFRIS